MKFIIIIFSILILYSRETYLNHPIQENLQIKQSLSTDLYFSANGPISGKICINIKEPADPHTWNNNYLCSDKDLKLQWSSNGPISGKNCIQIKEPADPHTWNDNYLCSPTNLGLRWSYAGKISGMKCISFNETSDPHSWNNNYLCYK